MIKSIIATFSGANDQDLEDSNSTCTHVRSIIDDDVRLYAKEADQGWRTLYATLSLSEMEAFR